MALPKVTLDYPNAKWSGKTSTTLFFSGIYDHSQSRKLDKYHVRVYRVSDNVEFWNSGIVTASAAEIAAKRFIIGYGAVGSPTALVYGTEYQWKARVWDEDGNRTGFTALKKFTPWDMPAIPTSLLPKQDFTVKTGATVPTVTIQGTYTHPEGVGIAEWQYRLRKQGEKNLTYDSGDITTGSSSFSQAYGTANSSDTPATVPDLAWDTVYEYQVRTRDSSGDDVTEWSRYSEWIAFKTASPPKPPTLSGPINGAVLFSTKPVLGWQYEQGKYGSGFQTGALVNVYREDTNAPVYGSPITLTTEATTYVGTSALTAGLRYKWNVQVKGYAGPGYSQPSEWGAFFVATLIALDITNPSQLEVLTVPTFDLEIAYTGAFDLVVYQVKIYTNQALTNELYDSGPIVAEEEIGNTVAPGQTIVHSLGAEETNVIDGANYWLRVFGYDEHGQLGISPARKFSINYTPPATITGVSAAANV